MIKMVNVKLKNKKNSILVKKVRGLGKALGLMFKLSTTKPLLFSFKSKTRMAIHSWFVFFPFLAVWLDSDFKVLEFRKVKPFTFHIRPKEKYNHLIEIPFNVKNSEILEFFDGKRGKV